LYETVNTGFQLLDHVASRRLSVILADGCSKGIPHADGLAPALRRSLTWR